MASKHKLTTCTSYETQPKKHKLFNYFIFKHDPSMGGSLKISWSLYYKQQMFEQLKRQQFCRCSSACFSRENNLQQMCQPLSVWLSFTWTWPFWIDIKPRWHPNRFCQGKTNRCSMYLYSSFIDHHASVCYANYYIWKYMWFLLSALMSECTQFF